jgi:mono/diheme cytochrome c family protein
MRRPGLPTLTLGLSVIAFAAAAAAAPTAPPSGNASAGYGADPGGGAVPVPPAGPGDVTADLPSWGPPNGGAAPASAADQGSADPIARGRYLVDAGDCKTCHTLPGGEPFAGGRPIGTPFGAIYSSNITPDPRTGIGAWSEEEFYRAMHKGVGHGGKNLYPAFPYPYFTRMPRADVDAVRAYLSTLAPVYRVKPANHLPFPINIRFLLKLWNALFLHAGDFRPDPARSEAWNRGAYLVQGPGHCGGCHTPKNFLGADHKSKALQGGKLDNWVALNLTGDPRQGLARWSQADISEYLRTGRNARSTASGSMQEVVYYSTSRMSDADLGAIAVYLKDLPPGAPRTDARAPAAGAIRAGEAIFADVCSACHRGDGGGTPRFFPPMTANSAVQSRDPTTTIRIILQGSRSLPTPGMPTPLGMPAFAWKLDDDEVASVATFVRNNWGNRAPPVTAGQVRKLRHKLEREAEKAAREQGGQGGARSGR